jgi:hypothetical protein
LPLEDQCLCFVTVGPVGIEPTSAGLRDRCIALSATIPVVVLFQSAWRELNPRPSPYKDAALTPELHAECVADGAGEDRTLTKRIKSPLCCRLHHSPDVPSRLCV